MTAGYTKEKRLGLSERAGRLTSKGRSCATTHLEKENAINIYSELRFGRLVVDGRPCCPTESFEECLWCSIGYVVVTPLCGRRDTLSVPS